MFILYLSLTDRSLREHMSISAFWRVDWSLQWEGKYYFVYPLALLPCACVILKTATWQSSGSAVFFCEGVILIFVHSRTNTFSDSSKRRPCVIVTTTLYIFFWPWLGHFTREWTEAESSVSGGTYHNCGAAECYTETVINMLPLGLAYPQVPLLIVGVPKPDPVPLSVLRGDANRHIPTCAARQERGEFPQLLCKGHPTWLPTQLSPIRGRVEAAEKLRLEHLTIRDHESHLTPSQLNCLTFWSFPLSLWPPQN